MSDIIERAARAICEHWGMRPDAVGDGWVGPAWMIWQSHARAAVEAIREPTREMIAAGHSHVAFSDDGLSMTELEAQPGIVWRHMIDEALRARTPEAK